ncbi:peptidoglycan-binding domain-containing protein [Arsenicicoccus sp. oral taxon 190]|uniref:peptidoglycan-binding domain-containing protein n=1 Tax=Arsenicicoccus sp. oral taxon 190 TaxID=1658671 RepID=UPI0012E12B87|nr:peptidoglycan-binding domain-containing protein [Arsenicicoccus sp. oral taxon 190]
MPATSCDEQAKPGTVALAALLRRTYPGTSTAITRPCGTDALPTTEHYDGRAVDWFASARRPESLAQAESAVAWLTGPDEQGVPAGNARRLGVMYLIWNDRIWSSYRLSEGWRPYSGCAARPDPRLDTPCHRDHVHVSLSWEGAMGRTSWWTGRVASRDFGPCRTPDLTWAEPYAAPRARPCPVLPRPATPAGATPLLGALVRYSGLPLGPGSRNPSVRVLQQAVGTAATGRFDTATGQALTDWQRGHGVTPTGRTDPATWRALLAANQPAPR